MVIFQPVILSFSGFLYIYKKSNFFNSSSPGSGKPRNWNLGGNSVPVSHEVEKKIPRVEKKTAV